MKGIQTISFPSLKTLKVPEWLETWMVQDEMNAEEIVYNSHGMLAAIMQ